jgi:hypothetical protein
MFIEIKKDYEKLIKDYNDELETSHQRGHKNLELNAKLDELQAHADLLEEALHKSECKDHYHHEGYSCGHYPCEIYEALTYYAEFKKRSE